VPPRPTGRLSDRRRSSPISAEGFALTGPSNPPDPAFNAYRSDLADIALKGRVIASHYAEPLPRSLASAEPLRDCPAVDGEVLAELSPGEPFEMLDNTLGWAWGYAGAERRVGYVRSEALDGEPAS
jgi:hypothetical protein